jgi:uncharacterized protein with GYD domain
MPTFVMLIKNSPEFAKNLKSMDELAKKVGAAYKAACPEVNVTTHLALLGPYDFMDILEAPSEETAFKMAAVLLASGMVSSVETWTAMHYPRFQELMKNL